jgi:hypothetical protein
MGGASPQALAADMPSPADEAPVSIVVPTYRKADNLPLLVPQITAAPEAQTDRTSDVTRKRLFLRTFGFLGLLALLFYRFKRYGSNA